MKGLFYAPILKDGLGVIGDLTELLDNDFIPYRGLSHDDLRKLIPMDNQDEQLIYTGLSIEGDANALFARFALDRAKYLDERFDLVRFIAV